MSYKQSEFFYWDGAKWVQAMTHTGSNAVLDVRLLDKIGNSRKAGVTLSNVPKDFTSANTTDQTGLLSLVFGDYQRVLIRDGETHQVTFKGRIYNIQKQFNPSYGGNCIVLECYDSLSELRDFSAKGLTTNTNNWENYNTSPSGNSKRHEVIENLITDSIGGGASYLGLSTSNINNTDDGTASGSRYRFEDSATAITATDMYIQPQRSNNSILQVISELASEEPHTSATGDKSHGYNYYVDSNMTIAKSISNNWVDNPPDMLNYYKRGTRPTAAPLTLGLRCAFGKGIANLSDAPNTVSGDGTLFRHATKLMTANYDFNKPTQELFTHAILTYSSKGEQNKQDSLVTQQIELFNVYELQNVINSSSVPFYNDKDLFNHAAKEEADKKPPGLLQWRNSSGTWISMNAYVHFASATPQGTATASGSTFQDATASVADYESVLIGIPRDQVLHFNTQVTAMTTDSGATAIPMRVLLWNSANSAYEIPSGGTPDGFNTTPTFKFNSTIGSAILGKGRAKIAFDIVRPERISMTGVTSTDSIRTRLQSALIRTNMDIRRGNFTTIGAPYYSLDLKVKAVSSDVLTLESIGASTATIDLTTYGVKVGFTVQNFGTDSTYGIEVANNNASDYNNGPSFGYIRTMPSDTQLSCGTSTQNNLTYGWTHTVPSVGHYVRIHIPLRAGDMIRVENTQERIAGNHIITGIDFNERFGTVQTVFNTVGRNEDIALTSSPGLTQDQLQMQVEGARQASDFGYDDGSIPWGQRTFTLESMTFARTDYRTITWDSGKLHVDGHTFAIDAGSTYTTNSSTHLVTTNSYIYFNKDLSETTFRTRNIATQYTPDSDDIKIAIVRGNVDATAKAFVKLFGTDSSIMSDIDIYKDDPAAFIASNSTTAALLKKGAQPFTTTVLFHKYPNNSSSVYNRFEWEAGAISFGESASDTTSINTGISTTLAEGGTYYVYHTIGSASLTVTDDYRLPYQDTTVLMATVVVGDDPSATDYSPTILPYNGKVPTLSAVSIAANAITADAITTGSLDSHVITLTGDGRFVTTAGLDRAGSDQWTTNSVSSSTGGLLIDNLGILGTSASGGGDIDETEFYISAADGKAYFGGGKVVASKSGLVIGTGGGSNSFLKWLAPNVNESYIYRKQVADGYPIGALIMDAPQGLSLWGDGLDVEQIHFQSQNAGYVEHATIEAPANYSTSTSATARYTITLPTAAPTGTGQSLQTSGNSPYNQMVWASAGGGSSSDSFKTISVSGQGDVVADSATDTLTLVAGSNMTITTNASTDTITLASAGGGGGGSGTVNTGVGSLLAYYPSSGTTVDDVWTGNGTTTGNRMWWYTATAEGSLRVDGFGYEGMSATTYGNSATYYPFIALTKTRGTSLGSYVASADDDYLGMLSFHAITSGGSRTLSANIYARQVGSAGANGVSSDLILNAGSSTGVYGGHLRLKHNGGVGIFKDPGVALDVLGDIKANVNGGTGAVGKIEGVELKVTNGAASGKILTSDADGDAEWKFLGETLTGFPTGQATSQYFLKANGSANPSWTNETYTNLHQRDQNLTLMARGTASGKGKIIIEDFGTIPDHFQGIPYYGILEFRKSNTTSGWSVTDCDDGDALGGVTFKSPDTNGAYNTVAQMLSYQVGTAHSSGNGGRIIFRTAVRTSGIYGISHTTAEQQFPLVIDEGQRVGVGCVAYTTSSEYQMIVNQVASNTTNQVRIGGQQSYSALDVTGAITATGTITAGSDERLKENILTITGSEALDKLNELNPVTFDWKESYQTVTDVPSNYSGFLASEYSIIFPEATRKSRNDIYKNGDGTYRLGTKIQDGESLEVEDIKTIDPSIVIPYLVAAIKDLEARLKEVEG